MIVIYRCSETEKTKSVNSARWNNQTKTDILKVCFKSVVDSLASTDRVILVNDNVSESTLSWMLNYRNCEVVNVENEPNFHPELHPVNVNTCVTLINTLLEQAEKNREEIIYLCEDDYLHLESAIPTIKNVLRYNAPSSFFVPYDYPDRYTEAEPTRLYVYKDCHLRTNTSSTLTVAAKGKVWHSIAYELRQASLFSSDSWTNKAYNHFKCLSPIPGQATHLQEGCLTPNINWKSVYNNIKREV